MPADPLTAYLKAKKQRALVLDGGFGTELARLGKDLSQDDLWSARILADDPAAIVRVHREYIKAGEAHLQASNLLCQKAQRLSCTLHAGSDIATTSSYQASFEAFDRAGIGEADAAGLLRRSVQLAVQACREEHAGAAAGDTFTSGPCHTR